MNDILFAGKHFLTFSVSRHKHNCWELVYCTHGEGQFIFDGAQLHYQTGDVIVIPPEMPHQNVSDDGFTNVHLSIAPSSLTLREPALVRDDSNQSLLHLFNDAYYLFSSDAGQKPELLAAYGTAIVQHLICGHAASNKNRIVKQIEQSIVFNYADANYKLDALLRSMPYCADHLCRLFRQKNGITPHKYLINMRLHAAASLLASHHGSSSISEIARLSGFRNPLYFSRLFRQHYGVSPTQYIQSSEEEKRRLAQRVSLAQDAE